jgi:hypothetical protein
MAWQQEFRRLTQTSVRNSTSSNDLDEVSKLGQTLDAAHASVCWLQPIVWHADCRSPTQQLL